MYIEGINPGDSYVSNVESPIPFLQGQRGMDSQGREYIFQVETGAHTVGDVVQISLANAGVSVPLTTAAAIYNREVGVVGSTFPALAAGTGFWAQTKGTAFGGIRTSAAVAANALLYTTATPNAVDDTATASNLIRGMTLTVAAGAPGVFAGILNNPTIGTIADTDNQL